MSRRDGGGQWEDTGAEEFFPSMNQDDTVVQEPVKQDTEESLAEKIIDHSGKVVAAVVLACLAVIIISVSIGGTLWIVRAIF